MEQKGATVDGEQRAGPNVRVGVRAIEAPGTRRTVGSVGGGPEARRSRLFRLLTLAFVYGVWVGRRPLARIGVLAHR